MNLINDDWLPVRRESGKEEKIAPWRITEPEDPILALSAPRPDFNGALTQFLIGLLQTALMPKDENEWSKWLENPLSPEILKERFGEYAHAFETEGEKGAFMQDFDSLENGKEKPIFCLLIDSPGENTIKDNRDHFVKRDRAEKFCEACTITALFTLQVNAPSGGSGHRTSLRGGGPLTTLVVLDTESDWPDERRLWRNLWLNVLDKDRFWGNHDQSKNQFHDIFPWLAKTRTCKRGEITVPANASLLQMYWGMPRRIRIQQGCLESGVCDLCGEKTPRLIENYKTKPHGVKYESWRHHLSPYYKDKKKKELLPRHPKEGDVSYQHWLDYIYTDKAERGGKPAAVVSRFRPSAERWGDQFRLRAFGYECKPGQMKARCYYDKTFPLFMTAAGTREAFFKRVSAMTEASGLFAGYFSKAVQAACFLKRSEKRKKSVPAVKKSDKRQEFVLAMKKIFYQKTEEDFFRLIQELPDKIKAQEDRNTLRKWHSILKTNALNLFDFQAERGDFVYGDPKRIVQAKRTLKENIYHKDIKELLQLHDTLKKPKKEPAERR